MIISRLNCSPEHGIVYFFSEATIPFCPYTISFCPFICLWIFSCGNMFIGSNLRITCINDIIGYLSYPFDLLNLIWLFLGSTVVLNTALFILFPRLLFHSVDIPLLLCPFICCVNMNTLSSRPLFHPTKGHRFGCSVITTDLIKTLEPYLKPCLTLKYSSVPLMQ